MQNRKLSTLSGPRVSDTSLSELKWDATCFQFRPKNTPSLPNENLPSLSSHCHHLRLEKTGGAHGEYGLRQRVVLHLCRAGKTFNGLPSTSCKRVICRRRIFSRNPSSTCCVPLKNGILPIASTWSAPQNPRRKIRDKFSLPSPPVFFPPLPPSCTRTYKTNPFCTYQPRGSADRSACFS